MTYKLSGWVRERDSRKYLSLAVSEGQRPHAADEEVPF